MSTKGTIWCGADWHGDYSMYVQTKQIMQPEDTLYYLGDAVDRLSCSLKLFLALMRDPQVHFLMGNHEDMMYRCLCEESFDNLDQELWFINGGRITYNQIYSIENELLIQEIYEHIIKLYNSPYCIPVEYNGKIFYLSHAGFSFANGDKLQTIDYLWDREHILNINYPIIKDTYIIHGHTPVQSIPWNIKKGKKEIEYYAPNKIDIDLGTYRTHMAALLPLNDIEHPIYLKTNEKYQYDLDPYDFSQDIVVSA